MVPSTTESVPQLSPRSLVLTRSLLGILAVLALHFAWPWGGCKAMSAGSSNYPDMTRSRERKRLCLSFLGLLLKVKTFCPYQQILFHIPVLSTGSHVHPKYHQQGRLLIMIRRRRHRIVNYSNQQTDSYNRESTSMLGVS